MVAVYIVTTLWSPSLILRSIFTSQRLLRSNFGTKHVHVTTLKHNQNCYYELPPHSNDPKGTSSTPVADLDAFGTTLHVWAIRAI